MRDRKNSIIIKFTSFQKDKKKYILKHSTPQKIMIFENTSFKMSLQFLILSAIYGFLAPVFNAIPFIYYRADL